MRTGPPGFTLLEVLFALLLISVGLLGLAGTLGPVTALAGGGRALGRSALALESRLDRLRLELAGSAPSCVAPGSGWQRHPDGLLETWSAVAGVGGVALLLTAGIPGRGGPDTLRSVLPCP
jgi:prepilin-type N-terminal cleavage/methylation domain-containing protein